MTSIVTARSGCASSACAASSPAGPAPTIATRSGRSIVPRCANAVPSLSDGTALAHLGTIDRPLRVAIVGAGPAGLDAAQALLAQPDLAVTIDVINRFPTPYGLVRDGVAPDHQSIKSVIRVFDQVLA